MVSTSFESTASSTWHDPMDIHVRKLMMTRLQSHSTLTQQYPLLQTSKDSGTSPSLLQRLEWMLYHSAGSLGEYLHQPSLERRVQGLVTHYKRKRSETEPNDDVMTSSRASTIKRQRFLVTITEDESRDCSVSRQLRRLTMSNGQQIPVPSCTVFYTVIAY
ncbi:unnamed protein product [Peronospora farinosa]|uniref:Uncharacterized protein n=1 Tax=Peronospora farinosa TaxID=134698 RepID=A0ABN8C3T0_9STRA|nr:unnamed protein product [Peronospora farinosa]